jgi:hypothetical protein
MFYPISREKMFLPERIALGNGGMASREEMTASEERPIIPPSRHFGCRDESSDQLNGPEAKIQSHRQSKSTC